MPSTVFARSSDWFSIYARYRSNNDEAFFLTFSSGRIMILGIHCICQMLDWGEFRSFVQNLPNSFRLVPASAWRGKRSWVRSAYLPFHLHRKVSFLRIPRVGSACVSFPPSHFLSSLPHFLPPAYHGPTGGRG